MSIRAMMGFDHLPSGLITNMPSGTTQNGCGLEVSGYPLILTGIGGTVATAIYIDADKWVYKNPSSSNSYCGLPLTGLKHPSATFIIFGFRIKFEAVPTTTIFNWVNTPVSATLFSILEPAHFSPAVVPGREYFVEFKISASPVAAGLRIERRINGVSAGSQDTTTVSHKTAFDDATGYLRFVMRNTTTNHLKVKDMYLLDDVADAAGDAVDWLGPIRMIPFSVESVDPSGWSASDAGSLENVLNLAFPASGAIDSPYISNPTEEVPLLVNFSQPPVFHNDIHAVSLTGSFKSQQATNVTVTPSLIVDESEIARPDIVLSAANMTYGKQIGIMEKAPTGVKWSKQLIDNLTLKLTPVTGS